MPRTVFRFAVVAAFAVLGFDAHAQSNLAGTPFVAALKDGAGDGPVPPMPMLERATQLIQQKTGSSGDVSLKVYRVTRFKSQPACGRVSFGLYQASTRTFWGQFGGQLNVCDDGTPPLKVCAGSPELVLADRLCRDGSHPVDTAEVKQAIEDAKKAGGLSPEQLRDKLRAQNANKPAGGKP